MSRDFTLLLVEPDKNLQKTISEVLQNDFSLVDIHIADSSEQALRYLTDDTSLNCIIVNSQLTDGSGFDFISSVKQIERYTGTSILIMSEQKDRSHLLQAAACGASDFIIKPFTPRSLTLKLKKLITGQEFRINTRVATFEAFQVEIKFAEAAAYKARLLDISTGGCSVISELFNSGGCIYDVADISFSNQDHSFTIPAELIRTEKDPECEDEDEKELLAAFQFNELPAQHQQSIHDFIAELNEL